MIAIQLASKLLKEELGLKSNPDNYGKKIFFCGVKHKYLGVFGIKKNIYDYGWMKNDFCVNNLHIPIKVIIFAVEKGIADK